MNLSIDDIREIIREEIVSLGDSMLPGAGNEIPGLDPDSETNPLRLIHSLLTDGNHTDGEAESALASGETRQFTLVMHNVVASGQVYGVVISSPPGVKGGAAILIGPSPSGALNTRSITSGNFGSSVGRFASGVVVAIGTIENGPQPGLLKIAYGAAEAAQTVDGPVEIVTGDETITIPTAGQWLLTAHCELTVDLP